MLNGSDGGPLAKLSGLTPRNLNLMTIGQQHLQRAADTQIDAAQRSSRAPQVSASNCSGSAIKSTNPHAAISATQMKSDNSDILRDMTFLLEVIDRTGPR
jgi:hypothetical protein